jgi:hypothetical protein
MFADFKETWNWYADVSIISDWHYENPPNMSQGIPFGRTDGQIGRYDEANSRYSELFCEGA